MILCGSNLVGKELGGQEFTDNFDQVMKAKKCSKTLGFLKTTHVQVTICLTIFQIFSFLAKMLSFLLRNDNIFTRNENIENMQADHNLNGL